MLFYIFLFALLDVYTYQQRHLSMYTINKEQII